MTARQPLPNLLPPPTLPDLRLALINAATTFTSLALVDGAATLSPPIFLVPSTTVCRLGHAYLTSSNTLLAMMRALEGELLAEHLTVSVACGCSFSHPRFTSTRP